MSRTYNTMPYNIQEQIKPSWKFKGYPPAIGGAWPNRTKYARRRNRQFRLAVKQAIRNDQEIPVRIKKVAWDIW